MRSPRVARHAHVERSPGPVGRERGGRVRFQRKRTLIASPVAPCSRLSARLVYIHTALSRIPRL